MSDILGIGNIVVRQNTLLVTGRVHMHQVLYYPGFEIEDKNWLKVALLYIGKLRPIIPISGDKTLSDLTLRVAQETDLFNFYRPTYNDSMWASEMAYDVISRINEIPIRYRHTFNKMSLNDYFRDKKTHNFLIYDEKVTYDFSNFCVDKGYATRTDEGVLFNPEIGNTYMTILSNVISERNNMECITDNPLMSRYNILARDSMARPNRHYLYDDDYAIKRFNVAKSVLELYLPKGLNKIDLETIIQFRASNDYSKAINAFHKQIDSYLTKLEGEESIGSFEEELNHSVRELRKQFLLLTPLTTLTAFQVWSVINGNMAAEHLAATAVSATSAIYTINRIAELNTVGADSRFTRKYLSNLRRVDNRQMKWGAFV